MPYKQTNVIKSFYPEVRRIVDATEPLLITVTKQDCKGANKKEMDSCALARALERTEGVHALISRSVAYIIKGKTARRYQLPESVTREIVTFDRFKGFTPGDYRLCKPYPTNRLGAGRSGGRKRKKIDPGRGKLHYTSGVRMWEPRA